MKTAVLLVALLVNTALAQDVPVAEVPVNEQVIESEDRAGKETITSGLGAGLASLQDLFDGVTNGAAPSPSPSSGFQVRTCAFGCFSS